MQHVYRLPFKLSVAKARVVTETANGNLVHWLTAGPQFAKTKHRWLRVHFAKAPVWEPAHIGSDSELHSASRLQHIAGI